MTEIQLINEKYSLEKFDKVWRNLLKTRIRKLNYDIIILLLSIIIDSKADIKEYSILESDH